MCAIVKRLDSEEPASRSAIRLGEDSLSNSTPNFWRIAKLSAPGEQGESEQNCKSVISNRIEHGGRGSLLVVRCIRRRSHRSSSPDGRESAGHRDYRRFRAAILCRRREQFWCPLDYDDRAMVSNRKTGNSADAWELSPS